MPGTDYRGCAVSGATGRALELYEDALECLRLQAGDALALAREAVREAPAFVAAHQLEAALLLCSRDVRDYESAGWVYARLAALPQNAREQAHSAAIAAAVDGDFLLAVERYDAALAIAPRDAAALHVASAMDYYLGTPEATRERSARALEAWDASLPGFHGVLAIRAFALEECGEYDEAAQAALGALEIEPRDLRAQHAMTHVYEMQGRCEEGIRWMGARAAHWSGQESIAATHLWWHLALHHQQAGRHRFALELYDRRMRGAESISERIDAAALLWRLTLDGCDVGRRFEALAGAWAPNVEDAYCAFNDLHAMMAFAGAGRFELAHRLLAAQIRRVARTAGANRDMTRLVGLPASRALLLFARGEYAAAEALLRALPPVAHRVGGSHAQRDVLQLTRAAALQRSWRRAA